MLIKLQPDSFIDNLYEGQNGELSEGRKLPYPLFVRSSGDVEGQDFWHGAVLRVIGFQKDLAVQQIDLWWDDAREALHKTVGMYLVTVDDKGTFSSHPTAIVTAETIGE